MTPAEQAQDVIERWLHIGTTSENAAQKAGHRLQLSHELAEALQRLLAFHAGYRQDTLMTSALVQTLLEATFEATNGELKWASELPPGKAPFFRRALVNLIAHFKNIPTN
jgi:hypothetical protein